MDTQALVSFLTWASLTAAGGLIFSLIWFVKRIVSQVDRVETMLRESGHHFDLRITRLEDWREEAGRRQTNNTGET